jgi:hypothetical protein
MLDNRRRTSASNFHSWLSEYLTAQGFTTVGRETSRAWLKELGFKRINRKKGMYYDGHDRPDVQHYLHQEYLPALESVASRRRRYVGGNMEVVIEREEKAQQEVRVYFHDESMYHTNDIAKYYYGQEDDQELPRKGIGRCVHVSDFIGEEHGFLDLNKILPADQLADMKHSGVLPENTKSRMIIYPGKNSNEWWDCQQLLVQVEHFIGLFEIVHPVDVCMIVFDCSANHQAFADNALVVSRMNVKPGGKQALMRTTSYVHAFQRHLPTHQQVQIEQEMVYPADHPTFASLPKGMLAVVEERGLLPVERSKLLQKCKQCKLKEVRHSSITDCCLDRILSLESDFSNEKSALRDLVENRGHMCLFLPKFHCELNPIELAWGASKASCRQDCDYSFPKLKERVPVALDAIEITTIRRWFRLTERFADAYKKGLTGRLADFATRKYHSHRRLPATVVISELEEEFNKKKRERSSKGT